ncbi:MAG: hypothetical protein EAZ24_00690 [Burkholderiales bacterium]|nr:MAG: hypothetical protein EAZ24_00690 [Burkholderiales bacterium]
MRVSVTLAIFLLALSSASFGEGIPVNRETWQLTTPAELIAISESQREEIDVYGTLTLDSKQWKRLQRKHPSISKRVTVVPLNYDDCTCGMSNYVIRTAPLEVAFPRHITVRRIGSVKELLESEFEDSAERQSHLDVHVDALGRAYVRGTQFSIKQIEDFLKEPTESLKTKSDRSLVIYDAGPSTGFNETSQKRVDRLMIVAQKMGWRATQAGHPYLTGSR